MNNYDNLTESDLYDFFNIEFTDLILDLQYDLETCNIYKNGKFSDLFNIIYNNVDMYNISNIIKNIKKYELIEEDIDYDEESIEL